MLNPKPEPLPASYAMDAYLKTGHNQLLGLQERRVNMDKLYDCLLELLHQSPESPMVRNFLREIPPLTIEKFGSIHSYHFPDHGFRLDSDVSFGYIWWICLYFEHASGWEVFFQDYQPFVGELPSAIKRDDRRDSVCKKLGCPPVSSHQERRPVKVPDLSTDELKTWSANQAKLPMVTDHDTYYLPPYSLHFAFRISDGELVSMSMSKDRNEGSFERKMEALRRAGIISRNEKTS